MHSKGYIWLLLQRALIIWFMAEPLLFPVIVIIFLFCHASQMDTQITSFSSTVNCKIRFKFIGSYSVIACVTNMLKNFLFLNFFFNFYMLILSKHIFVYKSFYWFLASRTFTLRLSDPRLNASKTKLVFAAIKSTLVIFLYIV
jgi:hypothetical protein